MVQNRFRGGLCHIMENIMDFEFRAPDALRLKQEIRRWYYGGQDSATADQLLRQFDALFSGNMILDAVSELLWTLAEQSPVVPDGSLYQALLALSRRQIVGCSIRVYGITASGIQYRFEKWQADGNSRILKALEELDEHLDREREWRRANQISLPSALVALAGMAALVLGLSFLLSLVWRLIQLRDFEVLVEMMPSTYQYDFETTVVCLVVVLATTGNLLYFLPRLVMTLCAGLLWTVYHKGRFKLRAKRVKRFREAMEAEGLGGYCEKLWFAAQVLANLPPDTPQNRDPSRALLRQTGMDEVFQKFSVRPISRGWRARSFYKKVEECHVRSRIWVIILCVAMVLLRGFLLTGSPAIYLNSVIFRLQELMLYLQGLA